MPEKIRRKLLGKDLDLLFLQKHDIDKVWWEDMIEKVKNE